MKRAKALRPIEARAARFSQGDPNILPTAMRGMSALYERPESEKIPTIIPAHIVVKKLPAMWAGATVAERVGSREVVRVKARVSGGPTGNNGIGFVPRAFMR